jgi:hypothetical protein
MPYGPVTPTSAKEELADYIGLLTDAAEARHDLAKMGKVCEDFSTHYRALGICLLSEDADVDGFFHYLVQSALTRRHYLQGIQRLGGGEPCYRRASFIDPAFDAIAAQQWRLAADIFGCVSHTWLEGEEYEDDYCYAEFIRRQVIENGAGAEQLLSHWNGVLEGGADRRLDVAKALHARDVTAFYESLTSLLNAKEAEARAIADPLSGSVRADELIFFPNRWVSVEGLALLAIANRQGLDLQEDFLACPPLARAGRFSNFLSRGYPNVVYTKE